MSTLFVVFILLVLIFALIGAITALLNGDTLIESMAIAVYFGAFAALVFWVGVIIAHFSNWLYAVWQF